MVGTTSFDFSGESAIITGSTSGIGKGIAKAFARTDANVLINSRSPSSVTETVEQVDELGEGTVIGHPGDISDPETVSELVDTAIESFDKLSILVNNAAIWPMEDEMIDASLTEWDKTMGVNVRAQFYMTKLVATHMRSAGIEGRIVNITSQTGDRRTGNRGLYGVSNTAVNGFTYRMAGELAEDGIRMNAVSTDLTETSQVRYEAKLAAESRGVPVDTVLAEWAEDIPLGRMGRPDDLANAVLFLTSDRADYIVGSILRVAGGGNLN
jgi:NAD(P)-dependent dehydrogenase (short-subunit alcohol dehydrogenase family)